MQQTRLRRKNIGVGNDCCPPQLFSVHQDKRDADCGAYFDRLSIVEKRFVRPFSSAFHGRHLQHRRAADDVERLQLPVGIDDDVQYNSPGYAKGLGDGRIDWSRMCQKLLGCGLCG